MVKRGLSCCWVTYQESPVLLELTQVFPALHFSKSQYLSLSPSNELSGEPRSRFLTQEQTDSAAETRVLLHFTKQ